MTKYKKDPYTHVFSVDSAPFMDKEIQLYRNGLKPIPPLSRAGLEALRQAFAVAETETKRRSNLKWCESCNNHLQEDGSCKCTFSAEPLPKAEALDPSFMGPLKRFMKNKTVMIIGAIIGAFVYASTLGFQYLTRPDPPHFRQAEAELLSGEPMHCVKNPTYLICRGTRTNRLINCPVKTDHGCNDVTGWELRAEK